MKIMPNFIRKAMQEMIFPSSGGLASLLNMPRSGYNFSRQVNGYQSAIIMACVNWVQRTLPEAPIFLRQRNQDGSWDDLFEHPMLALLESPNPHYDGLLLQSATVADYTIDGNAYWMKIRSAAGRVVQLWWIPSGMIEPAWGIANSVNTSFITHYAYQPGGLMTNIAPEDIVHFRNGLDPRNVRKGLSPLKSLFREIFTDDEAANMTAALLKNQGVPGVVISPKEGSSLNKEVGKDIKEWFKQNTTGDRRGEPLVMSGSTNVEQFGFNPRQMILNELRRLPEERISGVLGVPAIVAGLGAGLARSTFANMHEAREMAYESNIIPTQRVFGSVQKRQLLVDFEDDITGWQVAYDLSEVRVLQEDENKKAERVTKMVQGGFVTVADAQRETNMPVDESQNVYLRGLQLIEVPAGTKALQISATIEEKSEGLTDEVKDILWKRVDRARVAWWNPYAKRVEPLYKDEGEAVVKAIKGKTTADAMIKAAEKAIDSLGDNWEKELNRLNTTIVEDFGQDTADDYPEPKADLEAELKFEFDPTSAAIRSWVAKNGADLVVTIAATNLDDVKRVILAGIDDNAGTATIARNLRQFYADRSPFKSMRVARTEVTKASAFGNQEAAKQSGVVKTKTWLSSRDDRVREEHEDMDGETVKLDDNFSNGLEFPSEPMCRCVLTFSTKEAPEKPERVRQVMSDDSLGTLTDENQTAFNNAMKQLDPTESAKLKEILDAKPPIVGDKSTISRAYRRDGLSKLTKGETGSYVPSTNQIYVVEGFQNETLAHEVGHLYMSRVMPESLVRPNIRLYLDAEKLGKTITKYAATTEEEYFAESFIYFIQSPGKLLAKDPDMFNFLKTNVFKGAG